MLTTLWERGSIQFRGKGLGFRVSGLGVRVLRTVLLFISIWDSYHLKAVDGVQGLRV